MRQPAGQLRRQFPLVGLGQRLAGLGFLGHVGRQQVGPAITGVGGEGGADAAARIRIGEFIHASASVQRLVQEGPQPPRQRGAKRVIEMQPGDVGAAPRQQGRKPPVGIEIDLVAADMGDMGGHHFGGQAGAGLGLGQPALGLLQLRDGGLELAVGAGQFLGMGQKLVGEFL